MQPGVCVLFCFKDAEDEAVEFLQSIQRAPGSRGGAGEGCLPLLLLLQCKAEAEAGIQQGAEMSLTSRGKEEAGTWLPGGCQHLTSSMNVTKQT